jgi:hypothetical protein
MRSATFETGLTPLFFALIRMTLYPGFSPTNQQDRQQFHHSLKEHHKISNIPTFRFEML